MLENFMLASNLLTKAVASKKQRRFGKCTAHFFSFRLDQHFQSDDRQHAPQCTAIWSSLQTIEIATTLFTIETIAGTIPYQLLS